MTGDSARRGRLRRHGRRKPAGRADWAGSPRGWSIAWPACSSGSAFRSRAGLDPALLKAAMSRDKKNRLGKIRFVLPRSIGTVELTDSPGEDDVQAVLEPLSIDREARQTAASKGSVMIG